MPKKEGGLGHRPKRAWAAAQLVFWVLTSTPAFAHKMKVFAAPEGDGHISGYVYFPSGGRGQNIPIRAEDAKGHVLYQGTTDDQGTFRFAAPSGPVTVQAEGQDGHAASQTIGGGGDTAASSSDDLDRVVQRAVAAHIRPLQEQLDATLEKIWWHDVMGGLGTILGLGGLAYGWTARREKRGDDDAKA